MKKYLFFLLFPSFILAQEKTDTIFLDKKDLKDINITAHKFSVHNQHTGKNVQTISTKTFDRYVSKTLPEIINLQSGIQIVGANSNYGLPKSLNIRGMSNSNTLILIDGVPVYDATGLGGAFELRLLNSSSFKKVEIMKGAHSTLYGSGAVAGVIHLITSHERPQKPQVKGTFSLGNYGVLNTSLSAEVPIKKVIAFKLDYSRFSAEGISEAKDTTSAQDYDKDGMVQNNFNFKIDITPSEKWRITPFVRFFKNTGQYDSGSFLDSKIYQYENVLTQAGLTTSYEHNAFQMKGKYSYQNTNRLFKDTSVVSLLNFNGQTHWANISAKYELKSWVSFIGDVEYLLNEYSDNNYIVLDSTFKVNLQQINPSFHALLNFWKKIFLEAGIRLNFSSAFPVQTTFSTHIRYLANQKIAIFAGVSSAYKTPSLYQKYSSFGNIDLNPEYNLCYELGIEGGVFYNKLEYNLTGFYTQTKDVIAFRGLTYLNDDRQTNYGLESELTYHFTRYLNATIQYSFVNGEVLTKNLNDKDTTIANLYRIGSHKMVGFVNWSITDDIHVGSSLTFVSSRKDLNFNFSNFALEQVVLKPYLLLNLYSDALVYRTDKLKFILFANINNLTNTDYQEIYGYSTLGINFQVGVKINFN